MHVKFYAEPCETSPGKWQLVGQNGDRTYLIGSCMTRPEVTRALNVAERAAVFCGAVVIA
jgi:hypothetical protein